MGREDLIFDHSVGGLPRVRLAVLPSPFQRSFITESGLQIWIKRDDLLGAAFGGNKVRKLELVLGRALMEGAEVIVGTGAWHSNLARVLAGTCAFCELECHLVLAGKPERPHVNAYLADLWGASVDYFEGSLADCKEALQEKGRELKARGQKVYLVPPGASDPFGAAAYAFAYSELMTQLAQTGVRAEWIVVPCSTMGTVAGLAAGRLMYVLNARKAGGRLPVSLPRVMGICVAPEICTEEAAKDLARQTLALLGKEEVAEQLAQQVDLKIVTGFEGEGYGTASKEGLEAARVAVKRAGIFLDECYTAKAMAALLALAAEGQLGSEAVVFWHTGGLPLKAVEAEVP